MGVEGIEPSAANTLPVNNLRHPGEISGADSGAVGDSTPQTGGAGPSPLPSSSLARLLAEVAALPPEHRAALAALIAPRSLASPAPGPVDDRLPWELKKEEGGSAERP
jgi:hypothetical protein